jgi:hypothetical protein
METQVQNRGLRAAVVLVSILAQLHLLFVVELHHHGDQFSLLGGRAQVSVQLSQWHSSSKPDPICDACQVARQGVVQPSSGTPLLGPDDSARKLELSEVLQFAWRSPSRLSSRAPPLS